MTELILFLQFDLLQNLANGEIYSGLIRCLRRFLRSGGMFMYVISNTGPGAAHGYPRFYIVPLPSYHR